MSRSTMRWSVKRFRLFVERRRQPTEAESAVSAAYALVRDIRFASYHAWEADALIEIALKKGRRPGRHPAVAALGQVLTESAPGDAERPLREANFKAGAHLLAFVRALHAATDLLAPISYWGLGLAHSLAKPIPDKRISPNAVLQGIEAIDVYPRVRQRWNDLLDSPPYQYLRALANTIKHRGFVKAGLVVPLDFTSESSAGLRIGRFAYDAQYESRQATDLIRTDFPAITKGIIRVGHAINAELVNPRAAA